MWKVQVRRLSDAEGNTLAVRGDTIEPGQVPGSSLQWLEEQGDVVWCGRASGPDEPVDERLIDRGGGWYELPDGTKRQGLEQATAALAELDQED